MMTLHKQEFRHATESTTLGAMEIKRLKHPTGKGNPIAVCDGMVPGLNIMVTTTGSKNWFLRATYAGRHREIGLGGYPEVTIERA